MGPLDGGLIKGTGEQTLNDYLLMVGAATCAAVIVTLTVPLLAAFCRRFDILDRPAPRKIHTSPTPRLTGIALFAGLWGATILMALVFPEHLQEIREHVLPILTGAFLVLGLGIIDDIRPLGGWVKLAGQLVAGLPLWVAGIGFTRAWIPFVGGIDLGILSLPVTILWFLILLNAINIIDGVDGLATATAATATLTLIWISWSLGLPSVWIAAAGMFGALVAFWRFNRSPAKVFMGDSGSLSLGYFFAVVALLVPIKRLTAVAFFVPLIAMLLPLAESALSFSRRSISGANPMRADAGHLHHRLLAAGWSANQVVVTYVLVTAVFGGFCVAMLSYNRRLLTLALGFFVLLLALGLGIIFRSPSEDADDRRRRTPTDED